MQKIIEKKTQTKIEVEKFCKTNEHNVRLVITTFSGKEVRISVNDDGSIMVHHAKDISIPIMCAPHDITNDESFIRLKNLHY